LPKLDIKQNQKPAITTITLPQALLFPLKAHLQVVWVYSAQSGKASVRYQTQRRLQPCCCSAITVLKCCAL
jgi:hypothetical protein